jgi:glucosamine 6-phosphate synthetase-like amidotransferase/phosphosugar isomerase protein
MCSIIAVSGNWEEEVLIQIMKNSRIRGLHSFGYAFIEKNIIQNYKFIDYNHFIESLIKKNLISSLLIFVIQRVGIGKLLKTISRFF